MSSPPQKVHPPHFINTKNLWDHKFRVFGFPEGQGYENGVWVSRILRAYNSIGLIQLEVHTTTGHHKQPCFSGTPVCDDELNGVIGMVVVADISKEVRSAFALPVDKFLEALPDLEVKKYYLGSGLKANKTRLEVTLPLDISNLEPAQQSAAISAATAALAALLKIP